MIKHLYTYSGNGTDPYRNLALEQYLTEHVADDACILYLWQNQNTVVIGRNQNAWQECRTGLLEQEGGTLARRLSGGGAVFHDMGNLNFTFSVSTENYDLSRQQRVILEACRLLGIQAELSGRNDLLAQGRKFSGNSFYNHGGRSFHNGTLLIDADMTKMGRYLSPSPAKIASKGVASVASRVVNLRELCPGLTVAGMTSAMVQSVEQAPQGLTVHIDQKGKEKAVSGEKVLCAIGRRPCWDGLFAPELVPETRGRSLRVDEDFRTSIPGVYAIGDVSAVIQLAHVAAAQGIACVDRLCGAASATDLNVVPSCIYSSPEIAVVGLTEAEAKEQGINAVSGKCTMFGNARTVIEDPGRCFMKLVADRDTGRLIGAQLMCQHASDIISQLSAALVNGLTVRQLLAVMRPHPSFEEAMTEALERLAEKL